MLTQADKDSKLAATKEEQIKYCKEVIKAAARYERLMALKDFTDMLDDLRRLVGVHEEQIKGWLKQLEGVNDVNADAPQENPLLKQLRIMEVVKTHQYRLNQIKEAVNYPEQLIAVAIDAREQLKATTEEDKKHAGNRN